MQTYSTRSGLKRAMDSIIVGAFDQAVEEGRVRQQADGRWYELPPVAKAMANPAFLNQKKGDTSLVKLDEKKPFLGSQWSQPERHVAGSTPVAVGQHFR